VSIPTTLESLSVTAASNGPDPTDDRSTADDGLRYAYAFIRQTVSLGANIASASTIAPPSTGYAFNITGTTTITTIASTNSWDGRMILLIFAGTLQLTHSSNLALPGSANITTGANDMALFVQTASGAWRMLAYSSALGYLTVNGNLTVNGDTALGNAASDLLSISGASIKNSSGNWTIPAPSSGSTFSATSIAGAYAFSAITPAASSGYGFSVSNGTIRISLFHDASNNGFIGSESNHPVAIRTNNADRIAVAAAGNVVINPPSSGYGLNIPTGTPASAGASGTAGDIAWDSSYIYVCTATNTWKRAALSTW
jgi:hypothetical protein